MPLRKSVTGSSLSELKTADCRVIGNSDVVINAITAADSSTAGALCFSGERRASNIAKLLDSPMSALVVKDSSEYANVTIPPGKALIVHSEPQRVVIAAIDKLYNRPNSFPGISSQVSIDPTAKIGDNCSIGPFVAISARVQIGDGCQIHPNVTIYRDVKIGKGCTIHAGAVIREECELADGITVQPGAIIGADGFGYIPDKTRGLVPVPQIGNVRLAQDVDVGANACIDRATLGSTSIGHGSKLDNLVQVGHNVKVGKFSLLCGQVGVAGSSTIGNQVVLAGQVGVADHLKVADGVRCGGASTVLSSLEVKGDYCGTPAIPAISWRRQLVALRSLPEMVKSLNKGEADEG